MAGTLSCAASQDRVINNFRNTRGDSQSFNSHICALYNGVSACPVVRQSACLPSACLPACLPVCLSVYLLLGGPWEALGKVSGTLRMAVRCLASPEPLVLMLQPSCFR